MKGSDSPAPHSRDFETACPNVVILRKPYTKIQFPIPSRNEDS